MKELQQKLAELMFDKAKQGKSSTNRRLYLRLIEEEHEEFLDEPSDTPKEFKELCDLLWVLIQYANQLGYDLEAGMNALVDEYNSKFLTAEGEFQPLFREDGKLLKNTGFKKADFETLYKECRDA